MYRYIILFFSVLTFGSLISCSEKTETESNVDVYDDSYDDFNKTSLESHDIDGTIMLPGETTNIGAATKVNIEHTEGDFKWDINIGQNFKFRIDDWGDDSEILNAELAKLKRLEFYDVKFIKKTPNLLIYKRNLKVNGLKNSSSKIGAVHETYHIFYKTSINGIIYVLKNSDEGSQKNIVDLLEKSFVSLQSTIPTE
jgi:hypothetical protein